MSWQGSVWNCIHKTDIKNVKVVQPYQTVQQVLDNITDASETNKYLVLVPSGHENEYFDWKPYVDVKFLDNLEERWQLDELEGWDDLDNWIIGSRFQADLVEEDGVKKIKLTSLGSGDSLIEFKPELDLRKYQGILFDFKFSREKENDAELARLRSAFSEGFVEAKFWSYVSKGNFSRNYFLGFGLDYNNFSYINPSSIDWSNVTIKLIFDKQITFENAEIELSNFRLVRTFPYPAIHIHIYFKKKKNYAIDFVRELVKRGIYSSISVPAGKIHGLIANNSNYLSLTLLENLRALGIDIASMPFEYKNYGHDSVNKEDSVFGVRAARIVFDRAGFVDAKKWFNLPYGGTNPYLEEELKRKGNVLSSLFGLPVVRVFHLEDIQNHVPVIQRGGIFFVKIYADNLDSDSVVQDYLTKIDTLISMCRFISLKELERFVFPDISSSSEEPLFYYTATENESLDVGFYHRKIFVDPNGYEVALNLSYLGLKEGDTIEVYNIGSLGVVVFDPIGINIEVLPGQEYRFVCY